MTGGNNEEVIGRNPASMFLKAVEEKYINIVRKCKSKTSTDSPGIDMILQSFHIISSRGPHLTLSDFSKFLHTYRTLYKMEKPNISRFTSK